MSTSMKLLDLIEINKECFSAQERQVMQHSFVRVKDDSIDILLPVRLSSLMKDEMFKVEFAETIRNHLNIEKSIGYFCWIESSITALSPSGYDFSQLTRAVIANSKLFWDVDWVKIVCEPDVYNLALGETVKREIKEALECYSDFSLSVLLIQCKK